MKDVNISGQISQIQALFADANSIGIVVSENHNLDKMAAALSLYLSLQATGKDASIVSKRDPIVEISNLVGINKVKKNFEGKSKMLVVSLPYKQGEIEKVSYNIEGNRININLFAAKDQGITFSDKEVNFIRNGAAPTVIVTVGVRNAQELQAFIGDNRDVRVVAIDNTTSNLNFAEVSVADNTFSSCSEIVGALIEGLGMPVDNDIAQNIMDGLIASTNNFSAPNTSPYAFDVAGLALKNGARRRGGSSRFDSGQRDGGQRQQRQQSQRDRDQQQSQVRMQHPQNNPNPFQPMAPQQQPPIQSVNEQQPIQPVVDAQQPQQPLDVQEPMDDSQKEDVPSDWFVPKVFKSSRNQGE